MKVVLHEAGGSPPAAKAAHAGDADARHAGMVQRRFSEVPRESEGGFVNQRGREGVRVIQVAVVGRRRRGGGELPDGHWASYWSPSCGRSCRTCGPSRCRRSGRPAHSTAGRYEEDCSKTLRSAASGISHGIPSAFVPLQAPCPCACITAATVRAGPLGATAAGYEVNSCGGDVVRVVRFHKGSELRRLDRLQRAAALRRLQVVVAAEHERMIFADRHAERAAELIPAKHRQEAAAHGVGSVLEHSYGRSACCSCGIRTGCRASGWCLTSS